MNATSGTQNRQDMMERTESSHNYVCPPANITAKPDEYLLEIEMPGVPKEGIQIRVDGNQLRIEGRRPNEPEAGEVYYRERMHGDCRRVFELAADVDSSKITARLDSGVLCVHIPKAEKVKPRKIEVSG